MVCLFASRSQFRLSLALLLGCVLSPAIMNDVARAVPVPAPYKVMKDDGTHDANVELTLEVVDSSSAKLVITFLGEYAPLVAQFNIPNPWSFSGVGESGDLVFRNAELTRIVLGISQLFAGESPVTVHKAELRLKKAADDEWDVTAVTDVQVGDQRPGESTTAFRLEPDMLDAEKSGEAIVQAYGTFLDGARRANIDPESRVREVDEATFASMLRANGEDPDANQGTFGITDRRGAQPVSYVRPDAPPYTVVHEVTHLYQNPEFRNLGQGINEGFTHFFAEVAVMNDDAETPYDFSQEYIAEVKFARMLLPHVGYDNVRRAYFGSGTAGIDAMRASCDARKGAGTFDRICQLITKHPSPAEMQELAQLLSF